MNANNNNIPTVEMEGKGEMLKKLYPHWLDVPLREPQRIGAIEWPRKDTDPVTILDEADVIAAKLAYALKDDPIVQAYLAEESPALRPYNRPEDKAADFGLSPMLAGARRMGHLL